MKTGGTRRTIRRAQIKAAGCSHIAMSLFKRPAWAQVQPKEDTEQSLFNHASQSHEAIVAEQHRKKQERAEKQRAKQERKERRSSSKRRIEESEDEDEDESSRKKPKTAPNRRITLQEGEDLLSSVGLTPAVTARKGDSQVDDQDAEEDIVRRKSPRLKRTADRVHQDYVEKPPAAAVVALSDSEDQQEPQPRHAQAPAEPLDPESDDEFAELRARAREKRLKVENAKKSQTPDVQVGHDTADTGCTGQSPPVLIDEPPVKILVWSQLPNTKPLIVYRKLGQRLQEIRTAWCRKQEFSAELTREVFLIHRMRRLYDVTTCRSIGLYVDDNGEIAVKGGERKEDAQVHLEAVTEEIFDKKKAEKAQEERDREKLLSREEDGNADLETSEAQEEAAAKKDEPLIRIMLRAKNIQQPYKLKVKPVSTMG